MAKMRINVPAAIIVEADTEEAILRWFSSFTYQDDCSGDYLISVPLAQGPVTATLFYDALHSRIDANWKPGDDILPSVQWAKGQEMAAGLEQVADISSENLSADPSVWEREIREDRLLPGREG